MIDPVSTLRWARAAAFGLLATGAVLPAVAMAQTGVAPHLAAARELVSRVDLAHTSYEHGQGTVEWTGTPSSYTDCSGLVDHLLMHSYGYDAAAFKRWFGSTRPSARRYYDAIVEQAGFQRLERVGDLRPGDIIAVKYLTRTDNTGHVMLVDGRPQPYAGKPAFDGHGEAWEVPVIDSSESGHGPSDTRHHRGPGGKDHDGLGQGIFRLYAGRDGRVTGFSWSTFRNSEFRGPDTEPVVLGRLVPGFRP